MNRELPRIGTSNYAGASYTVNDFALKNSMKAQDYNYNQLQFVAGHISSPTITQPEKEIKMTAATRRLVKVFIVDADENVPLENALLFSGDEKFTDLTDQELFFEIDINLVLKKHNENRIKIVNKKVKERTEYLEPARIRDLKMTVVNIASFQ